jgi:hypothetical protein
MEHPRLREAITFLKEIGSPQAQFLQCDGMRMRNEAECDDLMRVLKEEGVQDLNFTFYGQIEYHDRFAPRKGDYDLLMRMIRAALSHGLQVSAGISLTAENISQADVLTEDLKKHGVEKITMFVPHEEGRGIMLSDIRLDETDLAGLSEESLKLLNRSVYRRERDWITGMDISEEKERMLLIPSSSHETPFLICSIISSVICFGRPSLQPGFCPAIASERNGQIGGHHA